MKKTGLVLIVAALAGAFIGGVGQEKRADATNFYESSLHYTNRGLEYWYAKEQGGLERITGIPFSELPCAGCHVRSCDTCHKKEKDGKLHYSAAAARSQEACERCHRMVSLDEARKNPDSPGVDVHFKMGMKCLDCHTAREIHGDGTPYNSIRAPGAMDSRCENCHIPEQLTCPGLTVHNGKLDCNACHVRDLPSCYNCHFDTRVKEGKSLSIPLRNLLFLINHEGKVTLGSVHSFVYQKKTMITFAPSFPHFVMKEGRSCGECHATELVRNLREGRLKVVRWEAGELKYVRGIVPVLSGYSWDFIFLDHVDGRWVPIENAAEPLVNFSGYSSPLTEEQLLKLEKNQPER